MINMEMKTYSKKDFPRGSVVLMRVDLNVPLQKGKLAPGANARMLLLVPEVRALSKSGVKVVLMAHLGRPHGKLVKELSLKPVANGLAKVLKKNVLFVNDCIGEKVDTVVKKMKDGDVLLLENLRFYPEEEKNQLAFAKKLASIADYYVNNAFGSSHRKHASVNAITKFLPHFAGILLAREVEELSRRFVSPFVLVLGGVKFETKIDMLSALAPKANIILVGGGLAVSLLSARLRKTLLLGNRKIEKDELRLANKIMKSLAQKIILPVDFVVSTSRGKKLIAKRVQDLEDKDSIVDIGPETAQLFQHLFIGANTVIWNGPLGYIEKSLSRTGTLFVAKTISEMKDVFTVAGGGETIAFLEEEKLIKKFSFVSSGGGAMLVFLAGKPMPGLEAIKK